MTNWHNKGIERAKPATTPRPKFDFPEPITKQDPIRWDFSQEEIEKMMWALMDAIIMLEIQNNDCETPLSHNLRKIKDDWQRKIDWNIERGNWK